MCLDFNKMSIESLEAMKQQVDDAINLRSARDLPFKLYEVLATDKYPPYGIPFGKRNQVLVMDDNNSWKVHQMYSDKRFYCKCLATSVLEEGLKVGYLYHFSSRYPLDHNCESVTMCGFYLGAGEFVRVGVDGETIGKWNTKHSTYYYPIVSDKTK